MPTPWPALRAARAHDRSRRLPLRIDGQAAGSVAREHLDALTGWPDALGVSGSGVSLTLPRPERDAALAEINAGLRAQGLIVGWRDESVDVRALRGLARLACMERAAARFWGTTTLGAHATGYVVDSHRADAGRPTHLWIATRAADKATDPGLLDNLVGGGVPSGQTPRDALLREGWEEAGLDRAQMLGAQPGRVMQLLRDIPEGLQREHLHSFDLRLPPGLQPRNQDGEVQRFECLPVAQALALAVSADMTVDAALVTLDFALRHDLLPPPEALALAARLRRLFVEAHRGDQMP